MRLWSAPERSCCGDVPPKAIVVGNPARIVGYVGAQRGSASARLFAPRETGVYPTAVPTVHLHRLPRVEDMRGVLSVGQCECSVPFWCSATFWSTTCPVRKSVANTRTTTATSS